MLEGQIVDSFLLFLTRQSVLTKELELSSNSSAQVAVYHVSTLRSIDAKGAR